MTEGSQKYKRFFASLRMTKEVKYILDFERTARLM